MVGDLSLVPFLFPGGRGRGGGGVRPPRTGVGVAS